MKEYYKLNCSKCGKQIGLIENDTNLPTESSTNLKPVCFHCHNTLTQESQP